MAFIGMFILHIIIIRRGITPRGLGVIPLVIGAITRPIVGAIGTRRHGMGTTTIIILIGGVVGTMYIMGIWQAVTIIAKTDVRPLSI